MDKNRKDSLKKYALLILMLICVYSIVFGMYITNTEESKENEVKYNEMTVVYEEIVEEHGEYSFEAVSYQQIMDSYKPHYVPMWFIIFSSIGLTTSVLMVWSLVVRSW